MVHLLILLQAAAASANSGTAVNPAVTITPVVRPAALALADRPRGASVSDPSGAPVGVIDTSDANTVILLVGTRKIQVPANALQKVGGRLTAPMTSQQVESLMAASAALQEKLHPSPTPVVAPKGFKLVGSVTGTSAAVGVAAAN